MTRREVAFYTGALILFGAGWGLSQPLAKIAVSTGYEPLGLIFWQLVICTLVLAVMNVLRGRRLPMTRSALGLYLIIALIGTLIPNSASYKAITHLPSGVVSILLSLIPMIAFPVALGLRLERFSLLRFGGLGAGLIGVLLLIVPEASLPDRAMLAWIPVALIAPVCYAFEGNYVSKWGTRGLDAIEVLYGACLVGSVLALPLALGSGQFINPIQPWAAAEWALVANSVLHAFVYTGYVWLVRAAGAVFAIQVSYLVTGFGVLWALLILHESYSPYIWAALVLVLMGVFLVQPRRQDALAPDSKAVQDH